MTFQWSVTEPRRDGTRLCGCSGLGRPVRFCRSVLLLRDVSLSRTETDRQTDRQGQRQRNRQTEKETDRQKQIQRETKTE